MSKEFRAVFKGKSRDKFSDAVYLFYEYRGKEYMVCDEHNGYSEPMWVKHKNEQDRIDREIEEERKPRKEYRYEDSAECGFDVFLNYAEEG